MTDPVTDLDSFKSFIRERTRETWEGRQTPYWLSFVATELKKQQIDYRQIVGPLKLSQWAASNEIPDTMLVTHPTQRARIGVARQLGSPVGGDYDGRYAAGPNGAFRLSLV